MTTMRLIDADALIKSLNKKHTHFCDMCGDDNKDINYAHEYAVNMIGDAPTVEPSGDLISRADAIEAVTDIQDGSGQRYYLAASLVDKIRSLPSAEGGDADMTAIPEGTGLMQPSPNNGADLISRADVLGYIDRLDTCGLGKGKALEYFRKYVERVPSVSAEPKREQPEYCIAYGKGVCGYPIEACCECPKHEYYKNLDAEPKRGEWIPLDGKLPKIIGHHVLVTIKWADDDLEVCERCPTVADRYNIIAFQDLPEPYQGEPIKSELQYDGAKMGVSEHNDD